MEPTASNKLAVQAQNGNWYLNFEDCQEFNCITDVGGRSTFDCTTSIPPKVFVGDMPPSIVLDSGVVRWEMDKPDKPYITVRLRLAGEVPLIETFPESWMTAVQCEPGKPTRVYFESANRTLQQA